MAIEVVFGIYIEHKNYNYKYLEKGGIIHIFLFIVMIVITFISGVTGHYI